MSGRNTMKAPFISEDRRKELLFFQERNGLSFSDIALLHNAFIHSSYANESKAGVKDNERLEFLGDSVLSVVVSDWLYSNLSVNEGELTRIRSLVVSEDALHEVALKLGLDRLLLIGHGEELTGGRSKKAILADCTEALFAAVYLDMGFEAARTLILANLLPQLEDAIGNRSRKDYKTELQEYVQKRYKKVPVYTMTGSKGPEHDQTFYYTVTVNNVTYGPAEGHNRKDAEQNVARLAIQEIGFSS